MKGRAIRSNGGRAAASSRAIFAMGAALTLSLPAAPFAAPDPPSEEARGVATAAEAAPLPPTAVDDNYDAVEGQLLSVGAPGVLINDSDLDGDPMTAVLFGSAPINDRFVLNSDGSFEYLPPIGLSGTVFFRYLAFDGESSSNIAFAFIHVDPANFGPVFEPIVVPDIQEGTTLDVDFSATDPEGHNITFAFFSSPPFLTMTDNGDGTGVLHFAPQAGDAGTYFQDIFAFDDGEPEGFGSESFIFGITPGGNQAPVLAFIDDFSVNENEFFSVSFSATDEDGNELSFDVSSNPTALFVMPIDNGDGTGSIGGFTGFDDEGTYEITVTVREGGVAEPLEDSQTFTFTVFNVNRAPVLDAIGDRTVDENALLTVNFNSGDVDGDSMIYDVDIDPLATFANLDDAGDGTATLTVSPGFEDSGDYAVTVTVTDNDPVNPLSDEETFIITIDNVNRAPILGTFLDRTIAEGSGGTAPISAFDPDGNQITLSFEVTPEDGFIELFDFGGGSGAMSFAPPFGPPVGPFEVTVIATDDDPEPLEGEATFTLTILDVNQPPVIDLNGADPGVHISRTFVEDAGPILLADPTMTVADAQGDNLTQVRVVISNLVDGGDEFLDVDLGASGLAKIWDPAAGQLLILGDAEPAVWLPVLQSATYNNFSDTPTELPARNVTFLANDGKEEASGSWSTVSVTPSNDAPTIDLNGPETPGVHLSRSWLEDAGSISLVDPTATIDDPDNPGLIALSIAIQNVLNPGEEFIEVSVVPSGLTAVYDPDAGIFLITGDAPTASYLDAIRSATYNNLSDTPVDADRNVTFSANDGSGFGPGSWTTVSVTPVNDAPFFNPIPDRYVRGGGFGSVAIEAFDPDNSMLLLTPAQTPNFTFFSDNGDGTGTLFFSTSPGDVGDRSTLFFVDDGEDFGLVGFNFSVDDGGADSMGVTIDDDFRGLPGGQVTVYVSFTNVNDLSSINGMTFTYDPTVITIPAGETGRVTPGLLLDGALVTPNVNTPGQIVVDVGTLTPIDGSGFAFNVTFDVVGFPGATTSIDISPGSAQNSLGGAISVGPLVNGAVRVLGPNTEAPFLNDIGDRALNEGETIVIDISATDPDFDKLTVGALNLPPFATMTDNGDGSGQITVAPGANDAGTYTVPIGVTDDGIPPRTDNETIAITVNDVNFPPNVTVDPASVNMNEGETRTVAVTAVDPDGDAVTIEASGLDGIGSIADNGDGTATIQLNPGAGTAGGRSVTITVTDDGDPPQSSQATLPIAISSATPGFRIDPIGGQEVMEGHYLTVPFMASDFGAAPPTFSSPNLPSFAALEDHGDGTGEIHLNPVLNDRGLYRVTIVGNDVNDPPQRDAAGFDLFVSPTLNMEPQLAPIPDIIISEGESYKLPVQGFDPDGDGLQLLPDNLPGFGGFQDNGGGSGNFLFNPGPNDGGGGAFAPGLRLGDNGAPPLFSPRRGFNVTVNDTMRDTIGINIAQDLRQLNGQQITIDVNFTGVKDLQSFQDLVITYDPNVLFIPVGQTDRVSNQFFTILQGALFQPNVDTPGRAIVSASSLTPIDESGVAFRMTFDVVGAAGQTTTLGIGPGTFTDSFGMSIPVSPIVNGSFTVAQQNFVGPEFIPVLDQSVDEGGELVITVFAGDPDGDKVAIGHLGIPEFATFTDNGDGTATFTFKPGPLDAGDYSIFMSAIDDGLPPMSDQESFTVTVNNVNNAPTVQSDLNNAVFPIGEPRSFKVTVTDPDGDGVTVEFSETAPFGFVTDNSDGTHTIEIAPGSSDAGTKFIDVMVTDDGTPPQTTKLTIPILISETNQAPMFFNAPGDQSMRAGETRTVEVFIFDENPDGMSVDVLGLPPFGSREDLGAGRVRLTFAPQPGDEGSSTIEILAVDGNLLFPQSGMHSFNLTVERANEPPDLQTTPDQSMNEGETRTVNVQAADPDGDPIILTTGPLPPYVKFTDNGDGTGTIEIMPGFDAEGSETIKVIATDGADPTLMDVETFSLTISQVNLPPTADPIADQTVAEGDSISIDVIGVDPDGDPVVFILSGAPPFVSIVNNFDNTATINIAPGFNDAGMHEIFVLPQEDRDPPVFGEPVTFTLTVTDVNRAPVLENILDQTMDEGAFLAGSVTATDPDGDDVTLTVEGLPEFGSFTDNGGGMGSFSFSTDFDDSGTYDITVIATDDGDPSRSSSRTFRLTVNEINRAPSLEPIGDRSVDEGTFVTIPVTATDPDGDALTLSIDGLPLGDLDFAFRDNGDGTGVIELNPGSSAIGTYNVTVTATDNGTPPLNDSDSFTLTVRDVNVAPDINSIDDRQIAEGQIFEVPVDAGDRDDDDVEYTFEGLPPFATFTPTGPRMGTLRFTPGFNDAGEFPITITATEVGRDPALTDTEEFVLTVTNANGPPALAPIPDRTVPQGATMRLPFQASDPDDEDSVEFLIFGALEFVRVSPPILAPGDDTPPELVIEPTFGSLGDFDIRLVARDDGASPMEVEQPFRVTVVPSECVDLSIPSLTGDFGGQVTFPVTIDNGETVDRVAGLTILYDPNVLSIPAGASDRVVGAGGFTVGPTDIDVATPGRIVFTADASPPVTGPAIVANITFDVVAPGGSTATLDIVDVTFRHPSGSLLCQGTIADGIFTATGNRAPVIGINDAISVEESSTQFFALATTDPDGDNFTFGLSGAPPFVSIDASGPGGATLVVSPGFHDAGTYVFDVTATDDGDPPATGRKTVTLTVVNVNRRPEFAPVGDRVATEEGTLTVEIVVTDPDGDAIEFTNVFMPPFGSFTDNGDGTGTLTFTPARGDAGDYSVGLQVKDDGDPEETATLTFDLKVVASTNRAPILVSIPNQSAYETAPISVAVAATDPDGDLLSFTLDAGSASLFSTLTDNADGTGQIRFAPPVGDAGPYLISVTAVDGGAPPLSAATTFMLDVGPLSNAPIVDLNGVFNTSTSFAATFTEDDSFAPLADPTAAEIVDADSSILNRLTVQIANPQDGADETLSVDLAGTSFTSSFDPGAYRLSVSGSGGPAQYSEIVRRLQYHNVSQSPTEVARLVKVAAFDEFARGPASIATVDVVSVNDPPIVDLNGDEPGIDLTRTWVENGVELPIFVDGGVEILNDVDDEPKLVRVEVRFAEARDGDLESFGVDPDSLPPGVTADYDPAEEALRIVGEAALEAYRAVLRTLRYRNEDDDPDPTPREATVTADDGEDVSPPATLRILIVPTDDPFKIFGIDPEVFIEEGETTIIPVEARDPDGPPTAPLAAPKALGTGGGKNGGVVFTAFNLPPFGAFTDSGKGTGQFVFKPTGADSGVYPDIGVTAIDGSGNQATALFTLTVIDTSAGVVFRMGPRVFDIRNASARVIWTTDLLADARARVSDGMTEFVLSDPEPKIGHHFQIDGLTPGTAYTVVVESTGVLGGAPAVSDPIHFTTDDDVHGDPPDFRQMPMLIDRTHAWAKVRWLTNEKADSLVLWARADSGRDLFDLFDAALDEDQRTSHKLKFPDLKPGEPGLTPLTVYKYRVISTDADGQTLFGPEKEFISRRNPDPDPPMFVHSPRVVEVTDKTIALFWQTDENADTRVRYGVSPPGALNQTYYDAEPLLQHFLTIDGLTAATTYALEVSSTDPAGNALVAPVFLVTTASVAGLVGPTLLGPGEGAPGAAPIAGKTGAPDGGVGEAEVVKTGPRVVALSSRKAYVRFSTDKVALGRLWVRVAGQTRTGWWAGLSDQRSRHDVDHGFMLTDLEPETTYELIPSAGGMNGKWTEGEPIVMTTPAEGEDGPAFFTKQPSIVVEAPDRFTVVWETNEHATTELRYGADPERLDGMVELEGLRAEHAVTLVGLEAGRVYHFRATTQDIDGRTAKSETVSFGLFAPSAAGHWTIYR